MGYPSYDHNAREKVSAAMAILHLIVRPLTTVCLAKILHIRGGLAGKITKEIIFLFVII